MRERATNLDEIADGYDPSTPDGDFDYWFIRISAETVIDRLQGRTVLELGCSTGLMTELLVGAGARVTCVEGSSTNIQLAKERVGDLADRVTFVHSYWEDFIPSHQFSDAVACRALEHLPDPTPVLGMVSTSLAPGGRLHVTVPNAQSLHRRLGKEMGMIADLHELHDRDLRVGHYRVYDRDLLLSDLRAAGFRPIQTTGLILKPLSNAQMQSWPENHVRALHALGIDYPDLCGEVYACAIVGDQ